MAKTDRIPPDVLAEQWYGFMHGLIGSMQSAYRNAGDAINQKKMGERLGKKPSFISRCLSGQTNMTIRTIHDLARAMDCRLEVRLQPLSSLQPSNRPVSALAAASASVAASATAITPPNAVITSKDGNSATAGKRQFAHVT